MNGPNGSGNNNNTMVGSNINGMAGGINGTSPVKEGSFLQQTVSAEDGMPQTQGENVVLSPGKEIPVRWQS